MGSYSSLSSENLVKACVGSDNGAAWAEFVRRFQPLIGKVVLRVARHWEEPAAQLLDDLIQETYLKVCADDCRLLRSFQSRHPDAIFGFLKVVASSVVHDHYKGQRAHKRDTNQTDALSDNDSTSPPATGGGSLDSIEQRVRLKEVDETLMKLFQGKHLVRNRTIFWLHHREGMTAKAIASIPWIALDTKGVESTLRRMTHMIHGHINAGS